MVDRQPFGVVLKRLRLAAGLTHEALAERAGLGARTISDLERGISRAPRADTLSLLVQALGLSSELRAELEAAGRPTSGVPIGDPEPLAIPSNLPIELTSFVGREEESRAIGTLLGRDEVRLVTLTGPGGVGKTRLSLRVAAHRLEAFPDGVFAVALAPVADRDGAVDMIGRALDPGSEGRLPLARLAESLADRRVLLVLDNCEHLPEVPTIVAELLRGGSQMRILATSRAPLRVSGEQEFPIAPLPVPDPERLPSIPSLAGYAAVALFVERASRVRPDFALTADNAASVAAICARLDGLPLALELAAARIRSLPPRVLLERLGDATSGGSLRLLTGGALDLPERHQTLRDTIAWSHDLLDPVEQTLFRRFAVFAGGCTLEAAEVVCVTPTDIRLDVLDGLASLVDKSLLVQMEGPNSELRFVMLETIRGFAWVQLVAAGEETTLRQQHAGYYLAIVESTGPLLFASSRARNRAAAEQGNVQAALRWLVQGG